MARAEFVVSTPLAVAAFFFGAATSLLASWVLVTRIERMGNRLGVTEAMLGLIAAAAADAPEITSAVSALVAHNQDVGTGVVVGSNVFNLAALVGLGAVVAGGVALHRRAVLLTGVVSLWTAAVCVVTVLGIVPPAAGLVLVLLLLGPYAVLAGSRRERIGPERWRRWLASAVREEEQELQEALIPGSHPGDLWVSGLALVVVVVASVAMERAATTLGTRFSVPGVVVGAVVLAAVTSLPNAVAAIYLARKGRGAAMLSTALNSNVLNITLGLLLPAAVLGLGHASGNEIMVAAWYAGLTAVVLVFAYKDRGVGRDAGIVILAAYALFLVSLTVVATGAHRALAAVLVPPILLGAAVGFQFLFRRRGPALAPSSDSAG